MEIEGLKNLGEKSTENLRRIEKNNFSVIILPLPKKLKLSNF